MTGGGIGVGSRDAWSGSNHGGVMLGERLGAVAALARRRNGADGGEGHMRALSYRTKYRG
eukprot:5201927-Pyramimonas_sp.AAC.2